MINQRLIVAGIGTEIGKTISSAILTEHLKADYWKPIQSGNPEEADALRIQELISNSQSTIIPSVYNLTAPLSPHTAAELDGVKIKLSDFQTPKSEALVIELAGGIMVPINDKDTNLDLIKQLNLPLVLVSKNYLGSINHTLLSFELLKQHGIPVLGLIINGLKNESGERFILNHTQLPVILRINEEENFTPTIIENYAKNIVWGA